MKLKRITARALSSVLAISMICPTTAFASEYSTPFTPESIVVPGQEGTVWDSHGEFTYSFGSANIEGNEVSVISNTKSGASTVTFEANTATTGDGITLEAISGEDKTTTNYKVLSPFVNYEKLDIFRLEDGWQIGKPLCIATGVEAELLLTNGTSLGCNKGQGDTAVNQIGNNFTFIKLTKDENGDIKGFIRPNNSEAYADKYLFSSVEEYRLYRLYSENPTREKAVGGSGSKKIDFSAITEHLEDSDVIEKLNAVKDNCSSFKIDGQTGVTIQRDSNIVALMVDDPNYLDLNDYKIFVHELIVEGKDRQAAKVNGIECKWDLGAGTVSENVIYEYNTAETNKTMMRNGSNIIVNLIPGLPAAERTIDRNFDDVTKDEDLIVEWYWKKIEDPEFPSTPFFTYSKELESANRVLNTPVNIPIAESELNQDDTKNPHISFDNYGLRAVINPNEKANGIFQVVIIDESGNKTKPSTKIIAPWDQTPPVVKADVYYTKGSGRSVRVEVIATDNNLLADKPYYIGKKPIEEVIERKLWFRSATLTTDEKDLCIYVKDKAGNIGYLTEVRYIALDPVDNDPVDPKTGNKVSIEDIPYEKIDNKDVGTLEIPSDALDPIPPEIKDIEKGYEEEIDDHGNHKETISITVGADNGDGNDYEDGEGTTDGIKYKVVYITDDGEEILISDYKSDPIIVLPNSFNNGVPVFTGEINIIDGKAETAGFYKIYTKDENGNESYEIIYLDPLAIKVAEKGVDWDEDGTCDICGGLAQNCTCYEAVREHIEAQLPKTDPNKKGEDGWAQGGKYVIITCDPGQSVDRITISKDGGEEKIADYEPAVDEDGNIIPGAYKVKFDKPGIYEIKVNNIPLTGPIYIEKIDSDDPDLDNSKNASYMEAGEFKLDNSNGIKFFVKENGENEAAISGLSKITVLRTSIEPSMSRMMTRGMARSSEGIASSDIEEIIWQWDGDEKVTEAEINYTVKSTGNYIFFAYDRSGRKKELFSAEYKKLNSTNNSLPPILNIKTEEDKKNLAKTITALISAEPSLEDLTNESVILTVNIDDGTDLTGNNFRWSYKYFENGLEQNVVGEFGNEKTYIARLNQSVKLTIKDDYDNIYESNTILIDNIDLEVPTVTAAIKGEKVEIIVTDDVSGIKELLWRGGNLSTQTVLNSEDTLRVLSQSYEIPVSELVAGSTYYFKVIDQIGRESNEFELTIPKEEKEEDSSSTHVCSSFDYVYFDNLFHKKVCAEDNCNKYTTETHTFVNNECTKCGYKKDTEQPPVEEPDNNHTHSWTYKRLDMDYHSKSCAGCQEVSIERHSFNEKNTCSKCMFEKATPENPEDKDENNENDSVEETPIHSHSYLYESINNEYHLTKCEVCSYTKVDEHTFNSSNICAVCGYKKEEEKKDDNKNGDTTKKKTTTSSVPDWFYTLLPSLLKQNENSTSSGTTPGATNNYYQTPAASTPSYQTGTVTSSPSQTEALQKQLATLQQQLTGSMTEADKLKAQLDAQNKASQNTASSSTSTSKKKVSENEKKEEEVKTETGLSAVVVTQSSPEPTPAVPVTPIIEEDPNDVIDNTDGYQNIQEETLDEPDEINETKSEKPSRLPLIILCITGLALTGAAAGYFFFTKKQKASIDDDLLDIEEFSDEEEEYTPEEPSEEMTSNDDEYDTSETQNEDMYQ